MRLIRFLDSLGQIHFGVQQPNDPASALRIEGDILANHSLTHQKIPIAKLLAPVSPRAILCIGLNYRRHAEETHSEIPKNPVLFMKNPAAVQNPLDPIEVPTHLPSTKVDYEAELAIIIGKKAKNVPSERAFEYILGYTAANDVSARDWQKDGGGGQWCRGKTFDTFCPLGPAIVTPDEIPHPNALAIRSTLNGQTMQSSNTSDMIFPIPAIIAFLSASTTLLPGTVILTGTPEGVGVARNPHVFLKPGDTITVSIERIGDLTNPVTSEP